MILALLGIALLMKNLEKLICQTLKIPPQRLTKQMPIKIFDGKAAQLVTYTIYLTLFIKNHIKSLIPLIITHLS